MGGDKSNMWHNLYPTAWNPIQQCHLRDHWLSYCCKQPCYLSSQFHLLVPHTVGCIALSQFNNSVYRRSFYCHIPVSDHLTSQTRLRKSKTDNICVSRRVTDESDAWTFSWIVWFISQEVTLVQQRFYIFPTVGLLADMQSVVNWVNFSRHW